jgi:hypothetical protein
MGDFRMRCAAPGLLAAALLCSAASGADALDVGPKVLPLTIAGIVVEIPVAGSTEVKANADVVALQASATGDLAAIQVHALEIARGMKFPRDPCAHKGVNIVVNSIDAATIAPRQTSAVVDLNGRVTVWLCKKILGALLRAEIASERVSISAPVELYLPSPQVIALRLSGRAILRANNRAIMEAANDFLGDIDAAFSAQLSKLLDSSRARATIPPLPGLDLAVDHAAFGQEGSKLIVRADGRATMTSAAFASLLGFIGQ